MVKQKQILPNRVLSEFEYIVAELAQGINLPIFSKLLVAARNGRPVQAKLP
jgi:hypothetical protein